MRKLENRKLKKHLKKYRHLYYKSIYLQKLSFEMINTETKRHQLSKTVDLVFPPPRFRMHADKMTMNRSVELQLAPIREELLALKKQGAPAVPEKPDSKAEAAVKDAYKAALKEYNSYASPEYASVVTKYDLCKRLQKISALFDKQAELAKDDKKLSKKNLDELAKEQVAARDEPATAEGEEPVTLGYAVFTQGVNLEHPGEVAGLLQRLRDENPLVDLFFRRDVISKTKIRFTDSSIIALATTCQAGMSEFGSHTMATTLELGKKIMYPDHCVSAGIETCSLYPLFCNLPSFRLIVDRQERRHQWDLDHKEWKAKQQKKKSSKAKPKTKKPATAKVVEKEVFETFEAREVEAGFAYAQEHDDGKGNKKTTYLWRGIDDLDEVEGADDEEPEEGTRKFGFNFYIGLLCKNLKDLNKKDNEEYDNVRVSTNVKRFFSNLLIELIHRMAPQIRLLMSYKDAKTVSYEMVVTVLKSILIDSYTPTAGGDVELSAEHQKLFDDMTKKVEAYNDYHKNAKDATDDVDAEEGDVEAEVEADADAAPTTEADAEVEAAEPAPVVSAKRTRTAAKPAPAKAAPKSKATKTTKAAEPVVEEPVVEAEPTPAPVKATKPATRRTTPTKK